MMGLYPVQRHRLPTGETPSSVNQGTQREAQTANHDGNKAPILEGSLFDISVHLIYKEFFYQQLGIFG